MRIEKRIAADGVYYPVILSDEQETLSAAKAAGRVFVGIVRAGGGWLSGVDELLELPASRKEDAEALLEELETEPWFSEYLERVVRRSLGLPWLICRTKRLLIREFVEADALRVPEEPEDTEADAVFRTPELLKAYRKSQYGFYRYGMWAVIRSCDGALVGCAGVSPGEREGEMELGYHIYRPFRRRGYAEEACRAVIACVQEEWGSRIYARVKPDNEASVRFLKKLGVPYFTAEAPKI
ncbi:MAG: GNAT family N-acetyltransferase [Eubacteriales bacterium]|nr:GNAT family N-acetyltransferase [Eubacteriales bacterium]